MQTTPTPIHIGTVIRNAVLFGDQRDPQRTMNADALVDAVGHLFQILRERQVDYVLVGGIAMLQYVEGRNTEDIDLIMALASLRRVPELQVQTEDANFVRCRFGELQVDVLLPRNPLFETVRSDHTTRRTFVEQEVECASVEGLLLLKLYALPSLYRQADFARVGLYENDIAMLMYTYQPDIDTLLTVLAPYLGVSDRASVSEIVDDLRARIARFNQRSEGE